MGALRAQGACSRPKCLQFVLSYKRLSQGRFRMPAIPTDAERVEMDATSLAMLLDGIDVKRVKRPTVWTPPEHPSPR